MIGNLGLPTAADGFFSRLQASADTALNRVVSEALPNWVNAQIAKQSGNPLANPTFDASGAPARVDGYLYSQNSAGATPAPWIEAGVSFEPRRAGFFDGVSNFTLLLAAGAIGVVLLLALKR